MSKTIEAVFDGNALHPEEPLELAPNTRVRLTIELPSSLEPPMSFLKTARSLKPDGPADWSANLEEHLKVLADEGSPGNITELPEY